MRARSACMKRSQASIMTDKYSTESRVLQQSILHSSKSKVCVWNQKIVLAVYLVLVFGDRENDSYVQHRCGSVRCSDSRREHTFRQGRTAIESILETSRRIE